MKTSLQSFWILPLLLLGTGLKAQENWSATQAMPMPPTVSTAENVRQPNRLQSLDGATVTLIANDGFLIAGGGNKVLIDAIFTEGFGQFTSPSDAVLEEMKNATPPFDNITALLVTHRHADHVDPAGAVQHLLNDKACILIAPAQVNDLLKTEPGYEEVLYWVRFDKLLESLRPK
jgi:glyoxylase-like metal-dependent hydrolase (beta-lactamase superfamily II)